MKTPSRGLGGSGVRGVGRGAGLMLTHGKGGTQMAPLGPDGLKSVDHGRR